MGNENHNVPLPQTQQPQSTVIHTSFGDVKLKPKTYESAPVENFEQGLENLKTINSADSREGFYLSFFAFLAENKYLSPWILAPVGFVLLIVSSLIDKDPNSVSFVPYNLGLFGFLVFLAGVIKIYIRTERKWEFIVGLLTIFIAVIILSAMIFK